MKVLAWPLGAPWWRLLACLLVALAALAWMPDVFAQAAGAINTNFPYLGPDPQKAMSAYTIFGLQYKLFLAPLSGQGAVEGLYYLALLATMVGALLIVFNQKFRAPSTLGAWLILVVIMLFAPFNSRLLFYPVQQPTGFNYVRTENYLTSANSGTAAAAASVGQCSVATPCGFTPQLVGIHVASILQVAFANLFTSSEWRGLVSNMRAEARARQDPALDVGESWLNSLAVFRNNGCSMNDLLGSEASNVTSPNNNAAQTPLPTYVTMSEMWNEYNRLYSSQVPTEAPPLIFLPDQQTVSDRWGGVNEFYLRTQYLIGVGELLQIASNIPNRSVVLSNPDVSANQIALNDALGIINNSNAFKPADTSFRIAPGFFIAAEVANLNQPVTNQNIAGQVRNAGANRYSRNDLRRCYYSNVGNNVSPELRRQLTNCLANGAGNGASRTRAEDLFNPNRHKDDFSSIFSSLSAYGPSIALNNSLWQPFINQYRSSNNLSSMPVMRIPFDRPNDVAGVNVLPRQFNPRTTRTCADEGKSLKQSLIYSIRNNLRDTGSGEGRNSVNFLDNLYSWIVDYEDIPSNISPDGNTGVSSDAYAPSSRAQYLNQFFSTYLQDQLLAKAREIGLTQNPVAQDFPISRLTQAQKRQVVISGVFDVVRQSTSSNLERAEAERNATSQLRPSVIGFGAEGEARAARGEGSADSIGGWGAWLFNGLATLLGRMAIWAVSWFYGLFALAYWDFLQMFMDMAFMGILVFTPFLFLAGLIIPSNAPGVIMISIIGVFILKFTAVSMVLLNALGMLMYNLMDAGAIADSWVTKATLVIAMSGLYTGIIAFSLYLMFKVGDANMFVSKLAALDDAAKEAAKVGVTAATGVVAAAAGILGSGLVGAVSTALGGGGLKAAAAAGAKGLSDGVTSKAAEYADKMGMRGLSAEIRKAGGVDPSGPDGQALTEAEQKELQKLRETTPFDESFTFKGETYKNYDGVGFKSAREIDGLMQKGSIGHLGGDSYYNRVDGKLNGSDLALDAELEGLGIEADAGQVVTKADGSRYKVIKNSDGSVRSFLAMARDAALTDAPEDMGPDVQQDVLDQMAKDKGQRFFEVDGQWYEVVPGEAGKFSIKESDQAVAAAARANGTDQFAPGTAPAAAAPSGANGAPAQPAPAIGTPPAAPGGTPATGAPPATTPPTAAPLSRQEQVLQDRREERQLQEYRDFADRQIDNEKAIDVLKAKANRSAPEEKELKAREEWRDAAQKADLIGSMAGNFNKGKELDALWDEVKKGGFEQPGFLAGGLSGLVGGFRAFSGGASNIPVVGGIIKELVNEATEAPERARAWQVSGGYREAMKLQKDAKRGAAFRSELGATTGGYEYRDMVSTGSFQAQHDIAKSAAAQAVARQRSEWEALMYANGNQSFTVQQLQGIGRDDALMKVQSVRLEAKQMQEGTFMTKVLDAKGNIVDQEVKLSVGVLNDFAETAAWKGAAKKMGEGLKQQYGTIEKRYFRGPDSGWAKADRKTGTDRLSRFVTLDADTDYLQYGHIDMVEGKWSHLAAKGKYDAYKTLRMNEMVDVERHATTNIASLIASVNETAEKKGKPELKIPVGLSFAEIARNPSQKAAIMAEATSAMKDAKIALPLSDFQYRAERVSYREVMQKSMRNQRQLRILEKENQETIMKDSVKESMIRVKMDDNVKRVTRGTNLFGRRFEISEGPESINEKAYYSAIDRIAGSDIKKRGDDKTIQLATLAMSKFNAIFNDVASLSSVDVIAERKISDNLFVQVAKAKELGETLVKFVQQERLDDKQRNALFRAYNLKDSDYDRAKNNLIPDNEMVEISERWSFLEGKNKKNKK